MDHEAARHFVKLHIIAGQMSTGQMNDTDTFYTLTGASGEIFSRDKVRMSPSFTPMTAPGQRLGQRESGKLLQKGDYGVWFGFGLS